MSKKTAEVLEGIDQIMQKTMEDKLPLDEMPLETLRDYRLYNEEARRLNKKIRVCRYPVKQCPVELHPKQRIKFTRRDQPLNPLNVYVSNENIHFDQTLTPGEMYDLPECIIHYLSQKGNPIWKWFEMPNGERETRVSHTEPRFALQHVYAG